MIIESKVITGRDITWILRCPTKDDAMELSLLRIWIDAETENLDRDIGEGIMSEQDFEKLIYDDSKAERNLFLVAEVDGNIVGFTRCEGKTLNRFKHKAEFGICILKDYWGYGIGRVLLENIIAWADTVGIKKITLTVVETNTKAIQLYKKYGFIEEGLLIKDRIHRDGNYYNTVIMGRFAEKDSNT